MNSYLYGQIIPGRSVGEYHLGIKLNELINELNVEYIITKSRNDSISHIVEIQGISFFFNFSTELLTQITVSEGYKGKYKGLIGIGSILNKYKDQISYQLDEEDNECSLFLPDAPGIWIHTEMWGDDKAPIKFISVNKICKSDS
ncbi:hypothetical protein [Cohnella luojiensis]|uniref:Uncharacterized protein n=1 Tax=Cohnella luojiensis TaxID=652876 RepID=A0A4Y8LMR5_9BACL|nr:hypothetical protein [Cohnella luojiensis]TFE19029.1 hypothetical protein E2980_23830 [Cohnella luojiensis]